MKTATLRDFDDLSEDNSFESPTWHKDALADSEAQVAAGKATFSDWDEAKQRIQDKVARQK